MKQRHDFYYRKAKDERYAARSVYKLEEAQKKFAFIKKRDRVLDVGCAPGSWSKYLIEKLVPQGRVVGIDILGCAYAHPRFSFVKASIEDIAPETLLNGARFDVVVSDAMPNTTSDKDTNHFQSIGLGEALLRRLPALLKTGGHFYIKLYDGPDFQAYRKAAAAIFERAVIFKPKSSRDESREVYIFGNSFKGSGGE